MSYPMNVEAHLLECNGNSCGILTGQLEYDDTDGPEYLRASGAFSHAFMWRVDLGNHVYTWRMQLRYNGGGPCDGLWVLQRKSNVDDPIGEYCYFNGSTVDCGICRAAVILI